MLEGQPWLPRRSLDSTDCEPRIDSVVPLSQHGFRALSAGPAPGLKQEAVLWKSGGWLASCIILAPTRWPPRYRCGNKPPK